MRKSIAPVLIGLSLGAIPLLILLVVVGTAAPAETVRVQQPNTLVSAAFASDASAPPRAWFPAESARTAPEWARGALAGDTALPDADAILSSRQTPTPIPIATPVREDEPEVVAALAAAPREVGTGTLIITNPPPTRAYSPGGLGARVPANVRRWEEPILRWSKSYGLDPNLVAALMMTESGGEPAALSPAGAVGLMQIIGGPTDPDANIGRGCEILARNLKKYGKLDQALAAYNAGPGEVDKYGGVPPFRETRDHVFRVLIRLELYSRK